MMRALALALLVGVTWTPKEPGVVWTPRQEGGPVAPAPAPADPDEVLRLVLSGVEHTLWHEAGHLLISELDLPVIGQEEDAADGFATLMMMMADDAGEAGEQGEAGGDDASERLLDVAEIWLVSHWRQEDLGVEPDFFDEHDLDAQRGLRVVCMLAGEDEARAAQLVADWGLPEARAGRCALDLAQAVESWDRLLSDWYLAEGEPAAPVEVQYGSGGGRWRASLEQSGLLEFVAESLSTAFRLEPGLVVEAAACGAANAFWSPGERRITLCYELMADYEDLARSAIAARE